MPPLLRTPRLDLVPMTVAIVEAVMNGRRDDAERLVGARMPARWPNRELIERAFTASLAAIRAPLLVVQARDDEYGTPDQLAAIVEHLPAAQTLLLDDGGHSPHRAHTEAVLERAQAFLSPLP